MISLLPTNLYRPGDNFDLASSHVIPALIRKCVEAVSTGSDSIVCWGSGSATREFLHVRDCADAIVEAAAEYDEPDPVNIGTNSEVSIRDLTDLIAGLTGFEGAIRWDASQPDGQPRRRLDTARALAALGWEAKIPLEEGLRETIADYLEARAH